MYGKILIIATTAVLLSACVATRVSSKPGPITGRIVDGSTNAAFRGASVTLQQPDPNDSSVYRIVMETSSDAQGSFAFPSVPAGDYILVAVGTVMPAPDLFHSFAPTMIAAVSPGVTVEDLPLFPIDPANSVPDRTTAIVTGSVTTTPATSDVTVSSLQEIPCAPWEVCAAIVRYITVPLIQDLFSRPRFTTAVGNSCPPSTACGTYDILVRASSVVVRHSAVRNSQIHHPAGILGYAIRARAVHPITQTPNCASAHAKSAPFTVTAGVLSSVPALVFTGCS